MRGAEGSDDEWVKLQNQCIDFFGQSIPLSYSKTEKRAAKTPFGTVDLSFGQFRTFYNSPEASLNLGKCRDVILDVFIFVEFTLLLANAFWENGSQASKYWPWNIWERLKSGCHE